MRQILVAPPLLLCLAAISGCTNPLPFGPGRVDVALEKASVQRVTRGMLLPGSDPEFRDRPTTVIRFDVSSKTNLVRYFEDWDRMVQTRCFVRGAEDGRTYSGFAVGPLQEGIDISVHGAHREEAMQLAADADGKYSYTIYAFMDLSADDEEYVDGKPRGTFDLSSGEFGRVDCFVIGVTKAPVLFPRTNTFSMSGQQVRDGIVNLSGALPNAQPANIGSHGR